MALADEIKLTARQLPLSSPLSATQTHATRFSVAAMSAAQARADAAARLAVTTLDQPAIAIPRSDTLWRSAAVQFRWKQINQQWARAMVRQSARETEMQRTAALSLAE